MLFITIRIAFAIVLFLRRDKREVTAKSFVHFKLYENFE
jgi:hypothetical protein